MHGATVATRCLVSQRPCNPSMQGDRGDRISCRGWCGWCSNGGICSIAMMRKCEEASFWRFWELPVVGVEEEVVERSKLGQR